MVLRLTLHSAWLFSHSACQCRTVFAAYIAQDALYLQAFAAAYGAAIAKSDGLPGGVRETICELQAGVEEELKLHHAYAQQLGTSMEAATEPNEATSRYMDFLSDVAEKEVHDSWSSQR